MEKAIMAMYYHITSSDEELHHKLFPVGTDSWCTFNCAAAKGAAVPPHKHKLPAQVQAALLLIYKHLLARQLLERSKQDKTQNAIDILNNVIWTIQSKSQFASLLRVETAVAEAVCRFNNGCRKALQAITCQLGFNPGSCSLRKAAEKDARRIKKARPTECTEQL
ncbi:hypothetical protein ISCGN_018976 [Ixodes scapularis]